MIIYIYTLKFKKKKKKKNHNPYTIYYLENTLIVTNFFWKNEKNFGLRIWFVKEKRI